MLPQFWNIIIGVEPKLYCEASKTHLEYTFQLAINMVAEELNIEKCENLMRQVGLLGL